MSPAFSSNASESFAICSATLQIILSRSEFCLHRAVDGERDRALGEMPDLDDRMNRTEHRGMVKALADFPRLLFRRHAVLQVAPGHVEAERIAVDVVERLSGGMLVPPDFSAATSSTSW